MVKKLLQFFKKNWKTVAIVLAVLAVVIVLTMILGANKNVPSEETVTTTTLSQKGPRFNPKDVSESDVIAKYTINASYPIFVGIANTSAETKLNEIVANYVTGEIKGFKNGVADRNTNSAIPIDFKSNLTLIYRVEYLSDKLASIIFESEPMLAGDAHPDHKTKTINYNLEANKEIVLTDLFAEGSGYLTFLSNNTIKYLKGLNISTDDMIKSGAGVDIKNYSNFFITEQAIVFVFERYVVAPGAAGMQKVFFTFENLKNMLIQDGILKTLLVNKII
ncbi:MAG: RsiV family protein [Candidatus Parcubacteria bacterium]|nr:RsiV family protein [Candidatus Parcubacteria bacterium]